VRETPAILIVEDEAMIAMMLQLELQRAGYATIGAASTAEGAVALQKSTQPDLILMDIRLADKSSGLDAARRIRAESRVPIIFVTGYDTLERAAEVEALRPSAILPKPLNLDDLREKIAAMLEKKA
jgi:DNA-binding response OmpR family regulator